MSLVNLSPESLNMIFESGKTRKTYREINDSVEKTNAYELKYYL